MMQFAFDNKLLIIGTAEAVAWVFLGMALFFRYWNGNKPLEIISWVLSGFFGYVPHLGLPAYEFYMLGGIGYWIEGNWTKFWEVSGPLMFEIGMIVFIIGALIFGHGLVKKIDQKMKHLAFAAKLLYSAKNHIKKEAYLKKYAF